MNFKVVISDPKARKAYNKEIDQSASGLIGKKIGEMFTGNSMGLDGYKLELTGGSDRQGFPMRRDVEGPARKSILLASPPGFRPRYSGQRKRVSIRGNTVSAEIAQVNIKIVEAGSKSLAELFGSKESDKKEEKKEEKPAQKKA